MTIQVLNLNTPMPQEEEAAKEQKRAGRPKGSKNKRPKSPIVYEDLPVTVSRVASLTFHSGELAILQAALEMWQSYQLGDPEFTEGEARTIAGLAHRLNRAHLALD